MKKIIFSTDIFNSIYNGKSLYDLTKEEYPELTDEQIYSIIDQDIDILYSDFLEEFNFYVKKSSPLLLQGSIGRWNGRCYGYIVIDNFKELYNTFLKGCDNFTVYEEKGVLYIDAYHHDGSNHAVIKQLSKKGVEYYKRHDNYYEDILKVREKLFNSKNYSKNVNYFKNVYGA